MQLKIFLRNVKKNNIKFGNKFSVNTYDFFIDKIKSIIKKLYYSLSISLRNKIQSTILITKKYRGNVYFDHVYFELRTKCNSQCSFCKASIHTDDRPDISMNFELYKKIINELSENKYTGNISFFVNNEPLLVKDLKSYIEYASVSLPKSNLKVLTNGRKLNYISGKELFDAGITELELNLYIKNIEDQVSKGVVDFEESFIKNDLGINNNKSYYEFIYKNKKRIYFKILRNIDQKLNSRGGSAPNWSKENIDYDGFCSYPFWQINIKADGSVGQCCADFYQDGTNLNCKDLNIYEIWNSDFFKNLRQDLIKGDRSKNKLCKNCDFFGENFRRSDNFLGKVLSALMS